MSNIARTIFSVQRKNLRSALTRLSVLVLFVCAFALEQASAATIPVPAGGDLQAALNAAQPGDVITLAAGATYKGPFVLPVNSGTGFVTIRTSAADSSLPPAGVRIDPSYFGNLPKIVGPSGSPVISTAIGAHNFQFIGVEISPTPGTFVYNIVQLGDGSETSPTIVPHDIVFDRVYIHGDPTAGSRRGIAANGSNITVINSYIADCKEAGADTQAIGAWNGPGPLDVENNYLSAAGENILIGGQTPLIPNLVMTNITVKHNYFYKPTSWRGSSWSVKNLFELKNANQVVVDGNVFENNWAQSQNGFAILFTTRGEDSQAPWAVVSNVQFTNNIIRHVASGINILGHDDMGTSQQGHDYLIKNNLFIDVSGANWGGNGRLFQILNSAANVTISHNTGLPDGAIMMADELPSPGLVFQNNLSASGLYGFIGSGTGIGTPALAQYFAGYTFSANALIGASAGSYPGGNLFPATVNDVGFTDAANGNYALTSASAYHNAGSDGTDIGVNIAALNPSAVGNNSGGPTTPPPSSGSGSTGSGSTSTGSGSGSGSTGSGSTPPPPGSGTSTGSTGTTTGSGTPTRTEETGTGVAFTGAWTANSGAFNSGGSAKLSMAANSGATFSFNGTGASWIGYQDEWSGIAQVYVDGTLNSEIDTYVTPGKAQSQLYSVSGLVQGPHTLAVVVTGRKNASSGGAWIWVDAFDVSGSTPSTGSTSGSTPPPSTTPPTSSTTTPTGSASSHRAEQSSAAVAWSGSWSLNNGSFNSGGSAKLSMSPGSRATFAFNGTAVTWIAYQDEWSGIARVYIDGALQGTVDTYASPGKSQNAVYTISSLAAGAHTFAIEVTGTRNASSRGTWIWVDAFDYFGTALTSAVSPTDPNKAATASLAGGTTLTSSGGLPLSVDSAEVTGPGGEAPAGLALISYIQNGVTVSEAGVPASVPVLRGRLNTEITSSVNTGFAVANPNDSAATVSFFFTDPNGNDSGAGSLTLPPHGQIARFLNESPFNGAAASNGTFTFSSTIPVTAIALRGRTNERSEFLVTTLPIANPDAPSPATAFFPHYAEGAGWTTQFMLINPTDAPIVGTLSLTEQNGDIGTSMPYNIPPRASWRYAAASTNPAVHVGAAAAIPDEGYAAPVGIAVFALKTGGVTVSEAGVPSLETGQAFRMYAESSASGDIRTGFGVVNPSNISTTVTFTVAGLDGSPTGLTGSFAIPAYGQRALFLDEVPGLEALPKPFKGFVRVSTADNVDIAITGLRGIVNERSDYLVTTTSPTNENAAATPTIVFPQVVDGGGFKTQFILYSGTPDEPSSGTLSVHAQSGEVSPISLQ
jgi:hypothetical protein